MLEWVERAQQEFHSLPANKQVDVLESYLACKVPKAAGIAETAVTSEHQKVRLKAIQLLGKLGTPEARTLLEELGEDPDPMVGAKARVKLVELSIARSQ